MAKPSKPPSPAEPPKRPMTLEDVPASIRPGIKALLDWGAKERARLEALGKPKA